MEHDVRFTLSYKGGISEQHEIDLYDIAQALIGFQRSIALTTHLVLNNEIITQAPSLKGAEIRALPAKSGSWEITAGVIITISAGIYKLGTTKNDSPIGHIIYSVYDWLISETLGVHVDYSKSLKQLYEEAKEQSYELKTVKEHQLDSLMEKCNTAIREIHRPIYKTGSAQQASIISNVNGRLIPLTTSLSKNTYEYMNEGFTEEMPELIKGRVSSYNSNTFKGRIYVIEEGRPVAFELSENTRPNRTIRIIVRSLSENALKNYDDEGSLVYCRVLKNKSKAGHLKSYTIIEVSEKPLRDNF